MRLHLEPDRLALTPGEPAALQVEVYNDSEIIDAYVVGLVDLPASSIVVEPKELSLFPGTEGTVSIVFTPARDLPAGARVVSARVTSTTDAKHTQDIPLSIDVAARPELAVDIDPQTVNGTRRADFGLIFTNRGNTKMSLALSGSDAERTLQCNFDRPRVEVAPGEQTVARARVEGRRPFIGTPVARILTFKANAGDTEHQVMSTFIQRPVLTRGALTFLALLGAVAVWAMVLMAGFNRVATVQQANATRTAEAIVDASNGGDGGGEDGDGSGGGAPGGESAADGDVAPAGNGIISGQVLRGGGAFAASVPAADVVVEARRVDQPERLAAAALTDGAGAFALGGLAPGNYQVRAFGPGYAAVWWPNAPSPALAAPVVVGEDGRSTPIMLTIAGSPGSIAGILHSEAGPLAGATLSAGPGLPAAITGADGSFLLQPLPTPATYRLTITAAGFPEGSATIALGPGQQLASQQLLLSSAAGTIAGTIADGAGQPLGGVTILVTDQANQPVAATVSFAQGAVGFFSVTGVPVPGSYLVTTMLSGYLTTTTAVELTSATPTTNVAITMPTSAINGRVVKAYGDGTVCETDCGVVGAVLRVVAAPPEAPAPEPDDGASTTSTTVADDPPPADEEILAETVSGSDGRFGFDGLEPGRYELRVEAPGYESRTQAIEIAVGDTEPIDVALAGQPRDLTATMVDCPFLSVVGVAVTDSGRVASVTVSTGDGAVVSSWRGTVDQTIQLPDVPTPGLFTFTYQVTGRPTTIRGVFVDPVASPVDIVRGGTNLDRPCA